MNEILGNRGKRRYNPELAERINREYEKEIRDLEKMGRKIRSDPQGILKGMDTDFAEKMMNVGVILSRYLRGNESNIDTAIGADILVLMPNLSKEDIQFFNDHLLASYQEDEHTEKFSERAGKYISALIHNCPENRFTLNYEDNRLMLSDLGTRLRDKILLIKGDAYKFLGYKARNCRFEVTRTVGEFLAAEAENCDFKIGSSAMCYVGEKAVDCTIDIKGEIHGHVAFNIGEGTIIYSQGKMVYPKDDN